MAGSCGLLRAAMRLLEGLPDQGVRSPDRVFGTDESTVVLPFILSKKIPCRPQRISTNIIT